MAATKEVDSTVRPDFLIWDAIDEGYYEVDLAGRFIFVNKAFSRLLGLSPGDLIGHDNRSYMSEESAREIYRNFNAVFTTGESRRVGETELKLRDRPACVVEFTVVLRRAPDGAPIGFRGIVHDLTERKKSEPASAEDHARLRDLIQAIPDIVYFKDKDRRNLSVNEAFEKMCGRTNAEVIGKTDEEIFPPDLAAACKTSDERVLESGKTLRFEEAMLDRDGRETVYETIKSPIWNSAGEIAGIVGVSRNIHDRKQTEAGLRESEERFRTLYENATVGLYRTMPDGLILLANPTLLRILGYDTFEELAARNLEMEGFGPEYSRASFKNRVEKDGLIQGLEAAWKKKNGATVYVRESAQAIFDPAGRVKYYEGTVEDVTERKRAELELLASETKFRRIFDRSLEGIFLTTLDGRILAANKAMVRMFGYESLSEYQATNVHDHYVETDARSKIVEALKAEDEIRNWEFRLRRKDGTVFHALANATIVRDESGQIDHIEGMLTDISDLVQSKAALQSALREKETLLKEIYHRVKNNMQVVSSLLNLQSRYLHDPKAITAFQDSQNRIRSMSMIHEILYRSDSLSRVDFADYIRNLAQSLIGSQAKYPGRIELQMDAESVNFDLKTAIPLGLIINELVSNALKHAFPKDRKGTITIGLHHLAKDEYLLSVRDDGVGLPGDVELGQSKSMGLQLVETLTDQLDGRLHLGPPPGADFRISFHAPNS
ncbi:MAG: PAS domain S-box protein [Candidatus Aminicenantes bacterium]|nr:PAS domain S-box protein [Candidatus Aminicenantes bacterium]